MYWSADKNDKIFPRGGASGASRPGAHIGHLREVLEARLPELAPCARVLAGSRFGDTDLLDHAVARAAATWREPVGPELCAYVLCWYGYLLQTSRPRLGRPCDTVGTDHTVLFGALSPLEQVAIVLEAYDELPRDRVAAVAGRALAEFELEAHVRPLGAR